MSKTQPSLRGPTTDAESTNDAYPVVRVDPFAGDRCFYCLNLWGEGVGCPVCAARVAVQVQIEREQKRRDG